MVGCSILVRIYGVRNPEGSKPAGNRPLGRPWRRWEVGTKMDLKETGLGVWIGFSWHRFFVVVNIVIFFRAVS